MKILVSACLLGVPCRYDAKSKPDERVIAFSKKHELIPVCAEVLGGLETPRIPAEIVGDKVLRRDGVDVTREYHSGAQCVLDIAIQNSCKIAILKSKSPSCGKGKIYDGTYTKTLKDGNGICADLLMKNNITVLTEREIDKI
jgi:uncharacterized protein YbbK (DUF523 family)